MRSNHSFPKQDISLSPPQRRALFGPAGRADTRSFEVLIRKGLLSMSPWRAGGLLAALTPEGLAYLRDALALQRERLEWVHPEARWVDDTDALVSLMATPGAYIGKWQAADAVLLAEAPGVVVALLDPFCLWQLEMGGAMGAILEPHATPGGRVLRLGSLGREMLSSALMAADVAAMMEFERQLRKRWLTVTSKLGPGWRDVLGFPGCVLAERLKAAGCGGDTAVEIAVLALIARERGIPPAEPILDLLRA